MPSTKKTYTLLIDIQPPIPILSCSQVLPNRAQCWRGADYLVEEVLPDLPTPTGEKKAATTEDKKSEEKASAPAGKTEVKEPQTRTFQLCQMHTIIMQRADAIADQEEASGKEQPPAGEKGSIHSRMMQAEQVQRTTSMPRGETRG